MRFYQKGIGMSITRNEVFVGALVAKNDQIAELAVELRRVRAERDAYRERTRVLNNTISDALNELAYVDGMIDGLPAELRAKTQPHMNAAWRVLREAETMLGVA